MYEVTVDGLRFENTCIASPEQYSVYKGEEEVAYVRLRWGGLICCYGGVRGDIIYSYDFPDGYKGEFDNEHERNLHLKRCAEAINKELEKNITR